MIMIIVQMNRKLMKDFTFSNGLFVPAGTHLAVAIHSTHMDKVGDTPPFPSDLY